jgi:hypothetical protein
VNVPPIDAARIAQAGLTLDGADLVDESGAVVGRIVGGGEPETATVRLRGRVWLPLAGRGAVQRAAEAESAEARKGTR